MIKTRSLCVKFILVSLVALSAPLQAAFSFASLYNKVIGKKPAPAVVVVAMPKKLDFDKAKSIVSSVLVLGVVAAALYVLFRPKYGPSATKPEPRPVPGPDKNSEDARIAREVQDRLNQGKDDLLDMNFDGDVDNYAKDYENQWNKNKHDEPGKTSVANDSNVDNSLSESEGLKEDDCFMCSEKMDDKAGNVAFLKCKGTNNSTRHKFHKHCIKKWFNTEIETAHTCPICRGELKKEGENIVSAS